MVLATGARYRRLDVENLDAFEVSSIHYWASPLEAKLCAKQQVVLVWRWQLRWPSRSLFGESSRQGFEVVTGATISRLEGRDGMLEAVRWRIGADGQEIRRPINHLFLFIGAEPNTDWLEASGIGLDGKGFILTGEDAGGSRHLLETTKRGVFAIGDVRSKSVKRVAAAVGEGAQVVAALHAYLTGSEPNLAPADIKRFRDSERRRSG